MTSNAPDADPAAGSMIFLRWEQAMRIRFWALAATLVLANSAAIAEISAARTGSGTFIRFDGAKSEHLAVFCGGDGYEEASAEYSEWVVRSLSQANFIGFGTGDALASLELFHCLPSKWADMSATEKSQFCSDSEISASYAVRLNRALTEAKAVGMEPREALAVIRSAHCDASL
ncbi:hypothetical protein OOT46_09540 [Aquabacterium sp. A7-Y]|uniref:hypothetical protein n=1 Tax=Aquabacterium sp. A7-Y TaxID=1349605 RepID=UPI00223D2783|nr:hypothetical protein [Aquabacterium sp. A7-Y]MCW7538090.1 hypothetical protein [Aquabacterium sp. A7-Y]